MPVPNKGDVGHTDVVFTCILSRILDIGILVRKPDSWAAFGAVLLLLACDTESADNQWLADGGLPFHLLTRWVPCILLLTKLVLVGLVLA